MTVLGYWLIIGALVLSAASAFVYWRAAGGRAGLAKIARGLMGGSVLLVLCAAALLLTLILRHDFTNGYVYSYSDRSLPLHYLVSTFYAGQEGSFLFWILCSALLAVALYRFSLKSRNEPWVMAVFMTVHTGLLLLGAAKSPFRFLWQMFDGAPAGTVPLDGRGLNPLLQNFWMVIHPPVLFVGFAALAVPFSLTVAGLWKREYDEIPTRSLPWLLFAVGVLGLGIMLGGYWAYGVLGWGGYWGWDPVENSSLVPWIIGIALVHTLVAERRTGKYRRTNVVLSVAAFFFVIYSTFLTRSGILGDASVHSFTDPGATVYWMLVALQAFILIGGIWIIALRWRDLAPQPSGRAILTRETLLGAGALVLMLSAVVIIFGTSLPIVSTTRVEPSFYDRTNLPMGVLLVALVGLSLLTQWEMQDLMGTLRRSWASLLAAVVLTAMAVVLGVRDLSMAVFAFASFFALAVNLELAANTMRGDPRFLGGKLAHIGLAVFFLGVISTGRYSDSQQVVLPKGSPKKAVGHTLTYTGSEQLPDGKFAYRVHVEGDGGNFELSPVMFRAGEQGVMRNPDIKSFLTRDIYLSPVSVQESQTAGEAESFTITKGSSVHVRDASVVFTRFDMSQHGSAGMAPGRIAIGAVLDISKGDERETITPLLIHVPNSAPEFTDATSRLLGVPVRLVAMNAGMAGQQSSVVVGIGTPGTGGGSAETLIVDASVKPLVNFLWTGILIMMVGFVLAILKRSKES